MFETSFPIAISSLSFINPFMNAIIPTPPITPKTIAKMIMRLRVLFLQIFFHDNENMITNYK
jgi:hypothetical protein